MYTFPSKCISSRRYAYVTRLAYVKQHVTHVVLSRGPQYYANVAVDMLQPEYKLMQYKVYNWVYTGMYLVYSITTEYAGTVVLSLQW